MSLMKRIMLTLFILLFAAALGFAGGGQETSTSTSADTATTAASTAKEAPMLAEMVAAGTLPPVEERLPIEPLVLEPFDAIGKYGGSAGSIYLSPADGPALTRLFADGLLRLTMDGQEIVPNLAKSYDASADGKSYTFYLREGVKWSDGEPFTTDDIMFWYECALNEDLTAFRENLMMVAGEMGTIEKIDDYTVRFTFAAANPMFLYSIATPTVSTNGFRPIYPAHYMKQFFPAYTDMAELEKMVEENEYEAWTDLFGFMASDWNNPEFPVLSPWQIANEPGAQRLTAVRNPYYWKVDPEGKQLPYIDRITLDLVENREIVLLKAANGEIDWEFRRLILDDFTLLKENEDKGNYDVYLHAGDRATDVALWMNMSYDGDPFYHDLMNNTKFKRALSIAIDRDEINELFYLGLGTPRSITAIRSEPTYEADVALMNIEYDPDEANRILDELGFTKKNSNGIRLGPDGKPIFFTVFASGSTWQTHADVAQICIEYWRKIGIDGLMKSIERSVYYTMSQNNEFVIQSFTSPGTSLGNNWWMFPRIGTHNSPAYGRWFATEGKEGIEPPAGSKIRMAMDLYREALVSSSLDDVIDATKQILRWANEEIWGISIVGEIPFIGIAKKTLRNIPKDAPAGTHIGHPGNLYPEQWFFDN